MTSVVLVKKRSMRQQARALTAVSCMVLVAACGPLISLGGDGPADDVYAMAYPGEYSQQSPTGPVIFVNSPIMAEGLDGRGVAVRLADGRRTSLEGAAWSVHLSDLVRDYTVRALSVQTSANMISEGNLDIKAKCRLGIKVWAMEYVPDASGDTVEVVLQLSLVRLADSVLLDHPTFAETVTVASNDNASVVAAFRQAMKVAADRYGTWLRAQAAGCT